MRWSGRPRTLSLVLLCPAAVPTMLFYSQIKGRDLSFGQAPPWLHVQALPQGASARLAVGG